MQALRADEVKHRPVVVSTDGDRRQDSALGVGLKAYFDDLTNGPVPDRLLRLAEQLDAAFERGELGCPLARARRR